MYVNYIIILLKLKCNSFYNKAYGQAISAACPCALSIGLEPGGAGDNMIPGIVGIIEHGNAAACADIIPSIQRPTRDSCPVGGNEVIVDSVVLPLCRVFPTLDKRQRHVTASQEPDFTPTPVSNYEYYHQHEQDQAIQDPVNVKVHAQDRQEMPQNKQEWRISRQPNSGSPGKVNTARWRAIAPFI
jgi:hypothetical protein